MRTLELFAGTGSFSKVMEEYGHETFTIDNNPLFKCDMTEDLLKKDIQEMILDLIQNFDIIWMSPPCTTFSLASGNRHWTIDRQPKTQVAVDGRELLAFCERMANECIKHNKIFFIENPNGRATWFLPQEWLKRVWYCQYGDTRAKPTNIWTNLDITFKTCHRYNKNQLVGLETKHCHHDGAPRGCKTGGTQALSGAKARSVIPPALFRSILNRMKELNLGGSEANGFREYSFSAY